MQKFTYDSYKEYLESSLSPLDSILFNIILSFKQNVYYPLFYYDQKTVIFNEEDYKKITYYLCDLQNFIAAQNKYPVLDLSQFNLKLNKLKDCLISYDRLSIFADNNFTDSKIKINKVIKLYEQFIKTFELCNEYYSEFFELDQIINDITIFKSRRSIK